MKFHVTMLCGGQSMMLTPGETVKVDMNKASAVLNDIALRTSNEMIEFLYENVKITIYPTGNMMFYHFTDLNLGSSYAEKILQMIGTGI